VSEAGPGVTPPFRIGVIADTHGFLPDAAAKALAGVDAIIHAGDVGDGYVLDLLQMIAPVTAVRGNNRCISEHGLPAVANVRLGGVRVAVAHRLQDLSHGGVPTDTDVRIVITGHTHAHAIEEHHGVLRVNPGSPTQPRNGAPPSVAIVTIAGDGEVSAEVRELEG